jgi:hypothetical protein
MYKSGLKVLKSIYEHVSKDSEEITLLAKALQDAFAIQQDENNYSIDYSSIF